MPALRHAIEEAVASLWRGRRAGWLSMATIALALFVLGAFLLVSRNLERLAEEWRGAAEMSVFLGDEVSQDSRSAIEGVLVRGPLVAAFEYVSSVSFLSLGACVVLLLAGMLVGCLGGAVAAQSRI